MWVGFAMVVNQEFSSWRFIMSVTDPRSDSELLDLIRMAGCLSMVHMTIAMQVTHTSIRQRLGRLAHHGRVQRDTIRRGRGRPYHMYHLTTEEFQRPPRSRFYLVACDYFVRLSGNSNPELWKRIAPLIIRTLATGVVGELASVK